MRYVPLSEIKTGMILAMAVFDPHGRILVDADKEVTPAYIERFTKYGLSGVYIDDELTKDIEVDTIISPMLRGEALMCVREQDPEQCSKVAEEIVEEMMAAESISLELSDLKSNDDFTYYHSVNVALYSATIGMSMGLSKEDCKNLIIAGMFHDIGKLIIPHDILNKNGRLTPEEFKIMKSHALLSYENIKDKESIPNDVKLAIRDHHENVDGSGYPNGLTGDELNLYAKILHVADVFDALTSNRPYKKAYSTEDAVEYMMGGASIMFDIKVVDALIHKVPRYPRGRQMLLSDGRYCYVVDNQNDHIMRPVVRLMNGGTLDLNDSKFYNLVLNDPDAAHISLEYEKERENMIGKEAKATIVVVDDMKTNLEALNEILGADYNMVLLKSGRQIASYLKSHMHQLPDLILMDIDMPEIDGITTAKAINKSIDNKVPILFVSSLQSRDKVFAAREVGGVGYVIRPFKPVYLKAEIKRILTGQNDAE